MKNLCNKTRDITALYEIWVGKVNMYGEILNFEWRVLKKWQADDYKPYARWYVAAKSEATYGSWEFGDNYASEIMQLGTRIK